METSYSIGFLGVGHLQEKRATAILRTDYNAANLTLDVCRSFSPLSSNRCELACQRRDILVLLLVMGWDPTYLSRGIIESLHHGNPTIRQP
jgi:hypothetical protein